jgi:DNA helicase-2/ATP-dependent DNA helicase PcrA
MVCSPVSDALAEELPLDDEQRAAVYSTDVALAVLAGPGSGKTRVLSYRARHLLTQDPGARALLLTFTNKAAAEMKARTLDVALVTSDRIWASTFHTFAMRVLHAHGDLAGIGRDFEVLDNEERNEIAEEASRDANVSNRYTRWSYLRLRRQQPHEAEVVAFGSAYERAKRGLHALDFDDLVVYTADLFEQHPDVAEAYGTRYPHLLVDEFQDTNAAQFAIVRALSSTAHTVSVFADDDQAIYQFAGAEAANVRRFIAELGASPYPLTINYRCREAIVTCANRLIAADPSASGRRMRAFHPDGEVRSLVFTTIEEEAAAVAGEIAGLIEREEARPPDIAVLVRSGFRVRELLPELDNVGIPVTNWLGQSYEPEERRTLRICLSVVRGRLDDRQARRLFSLLMIPESEERDPRAILEQYGHVPAAPLLLEMRERAWAGAQVRDVVERAQAAAATIDPALGDAIAPVVEAVAAFQDYDPEFSLDHLLAELALGGAGGPPTVGGGIKVASLHRTKGLQWPHVYILGLEEGRLPDYRARTPEAIREERRACFVGVCRAEQRLTLTRTHFYKVIREHPSRFLAEMGLS